MVRTHPDIKRKPGSVLDDEILDSKVPFTIARCEESGKSVMEFVLETSLLLQSVLRLINPTMGS